ncbi:MAG: hypothetical protein ACTSRC_20605 [Candidatus Helarchaeota archaeon]
MSHQSSPRNRGNIASLLDPKKLTWCHCSDGIHLRTVPELERLMAAVVPIDKPRQKYHWTEQYDVRTSYRQFYLITIDLNVVLKCDYAIPAV